MDSDIKESPTIASRVLARFVDIIMILALIELLPGVGLYAGIIYILIGDSIFQGGSVGKKLMRISVIRIVDQKPCPPRESIIRNVTLGTAILSTRIPVIGYVIAGLIVILEFLMMLGNKEGRRLGDELAGTRVVSIE